MRDLGILLIAVLWGAGPALAQNPPPLASVFGGPFELINHQGQVVTDEDFRGHYMLISFGYTFCPDICPTTLATMATALDELGSEAERIQPLFISVDPARDRPEILKEYVSAFHSRLIGLSGSQTQIKHVAQQYRVHRMKVLEAGKAAEHYLVNHSSLTYLMGPDGGFLTLFPHGTSAHLMAQKLKPYLHQAEISKND